MGTPLSSPLPLPPGLPPQSPASPTWPEARLPSQPADVNPGASANHVMPSFDPLNSLPGLQPTPWDSLPGFRPSTLEMPPESRQSSTPHVPPGPSRPPVERTPIKPNSKVENTTPRTEWRDGKLRNVWVENGKAKVGDIEDEAESPALLALRQQVATLEAQVAKLEAQVAIYQVATLQLLAQQQQQSTPPWLMPGERTHT